MNTGSKLHKENNYHKQCLSRSKLQTLFDVLHRQKYQIIGPVIRDGAIIFEQINDAS